MGAADVVPGVSGGTIAFITGIYDQLLASINAFNFKTLMLLKKEGFKAVWTEVNGSFLLALGTGIAISFLTLARVFKFLLDTYPHLLWGFFFGLIIGSVILVRTMVSKWNWQAIAGLIIGTVVSYGFTIMQPGNGDYQLWFVFVSGAIAICAMILPGISGSFILLLMGMYYPMLKAVKDFDLIFVGVLGFGAIVGLLSFSRLLKWTLDHHRNVTVAVLIGFLIGSLNEIWPWKNTLEFRVNSHGEEVPYIQENVLPSAMEDPQTGLVLLLLAAGVGIILLLARFAPKEDA